MIVEQMAAQSSYSTPSPLADSMTGNLAMSKSSALSSSQNTSTHYSTSFTKTARLHRDRETASPHHLLVSPSSQQHYSSSHTSSPLFDHVQNTSRSASSHDSDSGSSFARSPMPTVRLMEKSLPDLPPSLADDAAYSHEKENYASSSTHRSTPTEDRLEYHSPQHKPGSVLHGLGMNGAVLSMEGSAENPSNWINRRAAMKAASQSAGAGIMKFGKASAARLKQSQLIPPRNRDGSSPLMGTLGSGLWRPDARAAKSAVDLSTSSQRDDGLTPPIPHSTPDPHIGLPTDVKHNVHVDVGPYGYTGLPMSWAQVLTQQGINGEELMKDPSSAARLIKKQTEYYIDQEAQRGHKRDSTRRVLQSKLENDADLKIALGDSTLHASTTKKGIPKSLSATSTSYSSVLDTGWPSPTWSESESARTFSLAGAQSHDSPSLPEVHADDDDWATSLLRSIPASESNKQLLLKRQSKRRSRSVDFNLQPVAFDEGKLDRKSVAGESEHEEHLQGFQSDGGEETYDDDEEGMPAIATATKGYAGVAKLYRPSQLGHHSQFSRESRDSAMARRRSANSISHSTSTHSHHGQPPMSSSPSFGHDASPSGSSYGDASSAFHTTIHGSSSPVLTLSTPTSPSTDKPPPSNTSDSNTPAPLGLRERRKASPRIYPPSAAKHIPNEDNLSPYGFKRSSSGMSGTVATAATKVNPTSNGTKAGKDQHPEALLPLSPSAFSRESPSLSVAQAAPLEATLLHRKNDLDQSIQSTSADSQAVSLGSKSIKADRRESPEGPPLPPKAVRVPPGQSTPDFILPGQDGFYSAPGTSLASPSDDYSNFNRSSIRQKQNEDYLAPTATSCAARGLSPGLSPAPSPLYSGFTKRTPSPQSPSPLIIHSPAAQSTSPSAANQSPSFAEDGNQHEAADFIEDWLKDDDTETTQSESPSTNNFSPNPYVVVPTSQRLSPRLAMSRQLPSSQHHSPSPALLQGLPPLRDGQAISSQLTPPISAVPAVSVETVQHWQQEQDKKSDGRRGQEVESSRDWRVRSLPPAPSADASEETDGLYGSEDGPGDRASISSLPSGSDSWLQMQSSDSGPPSADAEAYEAAAFLSGPHSRSSSRQSRSSSRNGSRRVTRTPRRSIDARRFPVSMHYANGFEPDVLDYDSKRESQHSLNFAEMVRARQSLDLDDVMPFNMAEAGEKSVPPVPPLPSKAFLTQNKVKADFPESVWHLSSQLRAEKATEVFGDLVIIGEGESGNVYSTIPREGCPVPSVKGRGKVAVKVVSFAAPGGGKESADRFEKLDKETALWRQSHLHRNIVTLYDVFVSPQEEQYPGVWVVQEFMSMSLADLIGLKASGLHITEPHMARILLDGVLALEHLHYQNIIHRDVRSDNLLLTFDGVAKLTDFTHATRMEKDKKENCVVGTAYWMAPEVVKAEDYTSKVDIWSLGVVLYELVEGDPPRVDFPALRAITLTAKLGLPALSQPHLHSSALRHCLAWCTEMDPEKRPSADMLPHSEFLSLHALHQQVADLMEDARMIEANDAATEEETLNDCEEGAIQEEQPLTRTSMRDSWNSQSTVHA